MKKILKYLRELSIIIIGVAITAGVGFWINNRNNKKDLESHLIAVKLELEYNAKSLDCYGKRYRT